MGRLGAPTQRNYCCPPRGDGTSCLRAPTAVLLSFLYIQRCACRAALASCLHCLATALSAPCTAQVRQRCVRVSCLLQLRTRRVFRRFIKGCKIFIEIRGPPMDEATLYNAVMFCLASNQRKAFEAMKQYGLRQSRSRATYLFYDTTVPWSNDSCAGSSELVGRCGRAP